MVSTGLPAKVESDKGALTTGTAVPHSIVVFRLPSPLPERQH